MTRSIVRIARSKLRWATVALTVTAFPLSVKSEESEPRYLHRFPDSNAKHVPPASEYDGPLFRLSQQYPVKCPDIDSGVQKILAIPFDENSEKENWREYLLAVRDYCLEGNVDVDWRGEDNDVRTWYHVPWQHMGEKGREGIHGLTREATAKPRQLAPAQLKRHQTHAVALYNDLGGWTIGEVWRDQFQPEPTKALFPVGTVVVKILFTQADEKEVPYLVHPITWKAYVQDPADQRPQAERVRIVQDLRLLQMDVMVRDPRADKTGGWVFGTYCYNGALNRRDPWTNLVPVG